MRVTYRALRPPFHSGWSSSSRGDDIGEADVETDLLNLLLEIQSDVWNSVHRAWPNPHGKLGRSCGFRDLPYPEVEIRGGAIHLSFKGREGVLTLRPIPVAELHAS